MFMQRNVHAQVLSCTCIFMHRNLHAYVHLCTGTFIKRYSHRQVGQGRAEAGVARLSSASESATLEFVDKDVLMRGSLERGEAEGPRGEQERLVFFT